MTPTANEVTQLLESAGRGSRDAWERLAPLIYNELRSLAEAAMSRENLGHTLQPTALVHEAFIRLAGQEQANWNNRRHFYGAAAETMRRILVDHARGRRAQKRGAGAAAESLDAVLLSFEDRSTDLIDLDMALIRLGKLSPDQVKIVELRFFGGLTIEETAEVMGLSPSSVERGWRTARAFLLREVGGTGP
ncbi:MAG: RNA polymerase subunit sigma-70 [Planctomycetota bacterium]|nr:MAG: RNA polymerase subunit sigma-70 [Planctomycetota bacterium]